MRNLLLVHVIAGGLGLLSGYVALYANKGAPLHRRAGMLFVWVMLVMSVTGFLVSAINGIAPLINVPTALLTAYLVITGLTTVRQSRSPWIDSASMIAAFLISAGCLVMGARAVSQGGAAAFGFGFPLFLFGGVALAAGIGDRRVARDGALKGAPRLKRHLWRMCFGTFVASIAFYLGPDRLPEALQSPAFRAAGVLLPLMVMAYWLWRLRARRAAHSITRVTLKEAYR
jgi:uncharacterized membrane protein